MSAPFEVRAVLFDLDGTLADTAPDLGGAVNRMRERRGMGALSLEALRPVASSGARGMLGVGFDVAPGMPHYALDRDSRLFEGITECLAALRAQGLSWGIVTNKAERFTRPVVAGLGLAAHAAVVISGDTTPHPKPHPAPLLEACRQLGIAVHQAVYVGDDLRDMQAARAAGMPCIAAAYGYLGGTPDVSAWEPDAVIATPAALPALLRAL